VNGISPIANIKSNIGGQPGDLLFLTKPLGIGVHTTAMKQGILKEIHKDIALKWMTQLNKIGEELGKLNYIHALTDVTGFGLLGHLLEMCEGSGTSAEINFQAVPQMEGVGEYVSLKAIPGGTHRNWKSYGNKIGLLTDYQRMILADPQTSGGLLIAVSPIHKKEFIQILQNYVPKEFCEPIGTLGKAKEEVIIKLI
jgi:selenide,water dikinase